MRRWGLLAVLLAAACARGPGDPCRSHQDCASLSDGYCARAEICTRECDDARPCPTRAACVSGGGPRQVCLPTCAADSDCLDGFACDGAVCRLTQPFLPPPDIR